MTNLFRVARLQFLVAGLALYLLGGLWAVLLGASFAPLRLLLGYLVILPAQLSVHFSNDYFDVASDGPARPTLISGGGDAASTHYKMSGTIGEMAASSDSNASSHYATCSDFQCMLSFLHVYLPLVMR